MLVDLLKRHESAIVLGDPGSGKTIVGALTFAKMADEYRRSRGRGIVPLFVRLSTLHLRGSNAPSAPVITDLMPNAIRKLGTETLERLFEADRICIILDGLDELPTTRSSRQASSRMPDELVLLLEKSTIATCREAFHSLYVDTDRIAANLGVELELLPLTYEGEVVPFVHQYCRTLGHPEFAEAILAILRQNASLADTLSRPLMLRMTVDVLSDELEHGDKQTAERLLLTGSDFLNAQIYERYVVSWLKREHRKARDPQFSPFDKLALLETVAWQIFRNPVKTDAGYGSFELVDLTIDRSMLHTTIDTWIKSHSSKSMRHINRPAVVIEIEERTFLIVSEHGDIYRFAHKSFFEYLVARHVYNVLATRNATVPEVVTLLNMPFPDEIIDFLRELLHFSKTSHETAPRRRYIEQSLVNVVRAASEPAASLMARQQAANLLPIVATPDIRQYLRLVVTSDDHPFIRRAIAVGEALHDRDPEFLNAFVASLDSDERARSFHMGYNRIYYGDQPLSQTSFEDDGGAECGRFFRACLRHLELERYRYIRTMALATVRLMLLDQSRCSLLVNQELEGLRWVRGVCDQPDAELGPVYEHERLALANCIDHVMSKNETTSDNRRNSDSSEDTHEGSLKVVHKAPSDGGSACDE